MIHSSPPWDSDLEKKETKQNAEDADQYANIIMGFWWSEKEKKLTVSKTWCFTPSQPLQLCQGETYSVTTQ